MKKKTENTNKNNNKIIIAFIVVILIALVAVVVSVVTVVKSNNKDNKEETKYVTQPTTVSTVPANTDSWVDFDEIASNIATATDPSTTGPSTSGIVIPTMPNTSIVYVDPNGNVIPPQNPNTTKPFDTNVFEGEDITENNDNHEVEFAPYDIDSRGVLTRYFGDGTNVTVPTVINGQKVTAIGNNCFKGTNVKFVYLFENITTIGNSAFADCKNLERIAFNSPGMTIKLGNNVFSNCSKLRKVAFPVVESMGSNVFENCSTLPEVIFMQGTRQIGDGAFSNCYSLNSVTIPETVSAKNIGVNVFHNCDKDLLIVKAPKGSDMYHYAKDAGFHVAEP